jgi:menaquinone-dependent protoporphyrinogen oxidase
MTALVTYASKHGSTEGIARAIADRLREGGITVELLPIGDVHSVTRYDAAVIGSAVYLGKWMREARGFLDDHEQELREIPVWLFSSGPTQIGEEDEALSVKQRRRFDAVGARDHRVFGGAVELAKLGFLERKGFQAAKKPVGDFRNWADVEGWADSIVSSAPR